MIPELRTLTETTARKFSSAYCRDCELLAGFSHGMPLS